MPKCYSEDNFIYIINIIFEIILFTNKCKSRVNTCLPMSIFIILSKDTQSKYRGEHIAKVNNNAKNQYLC